MIVVSIVILIIYTLTFPSRCMARNETSQTERTLLQSSEPVSSPSTILSLGTNLPQYSTNLPSQEGKFAKNSTPQLGTVLSTVYVVDEEVTSPSTEEEASDRQSMDNGNFTVNFPANISTTNRSETKCMIIVPPRKCSSTERRDANGICRKKW